MRTPVAGVTAETYATKALAFMQANGGAGFVICIRQRQIGAETFPARPRQWAAWVSYFRRLGKRVWCAESQGHYTVPAEWPHEFDAAATMQGDYAAADAFEAKGYPEPKRVVRPRERSPFRPFPQLWEGMAGDPDLVKVLDACRFDEMTYADKLRATDGIESTREWLRNGHRLRQKRGQPTPVEDLDPTAVALLDISDFPPAGATRSELRAWEARRIGGPDTTKSAPAGR